jgi:hypothetical protein
LDGLVTKEIIPCLLVRPERVYESTTLCEDGREVTRYRIEVLMEFTSEYGLQQLLPYLHDAPELVGTKRLRTYIHAIEPEEMCSFFELKYGETGAAWKKAKIAVLPYLDVEYIQRAG